MNKQLSSKISVIHIRDSCGIYGAERLILTLAKNIDKNRFTFTLLALNDRKETGRKFIDRAEEIGLDVITVPVKGRIDISALLKIRKIFKEMSVLILHAHDFKANFYTLLASINLGIKKIVTAHGSTSDSFLKRVYLYLDDRVFYKFFDNIIAVSEKIRSYLIELGISSKKIIVIRNGIDLSVMQSDSSVQSGNDILLPSNSGKAFGVIGRLFPDKGHRFFLDAFSKVCEKYPSIYALIIGDGPIREELSKQINSLKLNQKAFLCGVRSNMGYVYNHLDYVVIPSLTEGLPYTLLEAMASKIPVLATAVGDIPLLIKHEETGYLVPPANVAALEQYMCQLLNKRKKAKEMAENGYQLVTERFSAIKMAEGYERIYNSLINS